MAKYLPQLFIGLLLIVLAVQEAYSAVAIAPHSKSKNPDYPNHCEVPFGEKDIRYYTVGTHQVKDYCAEAECSEDFFFTEYS